MGVVGPSLRPRGYLLPQSRKSEVSVPDALRRGRPGRMNCREGARRKLVAKAQAASAGRGFPFRLAGRWPAFLRPSEVPGRARLPDPLPGQARGPANSMSALWGERHASTSSYRVQYLHSLAFRNSKFWEPKGTSFHPNYQRKR